MTQWYVCMWHDVIFRNFIAIFRMHIFYSIRFSYTFCSLNPPSHGFLHLWKLNVIESELHSTVTYHIMIMMTMMMLMTMMTTMIFPCLSSDGRQDVYNTMTQCLEPCIHSVVSACKTGMWWNYITNENIMFFP